MPEQATVPPVILEAIGVVTNLALGKHKAAKVCGCHSCKGEDRSFKDWLRIPAEVTDDSQDEGKHPDSDQERGEDNEDIPE